MRTLAVLPARFASSRFPGKPLVPILGKPMVQWVWEAARHTPGIDHVVVATDDARIQQAVQAFGGVAVMTDPNLPSGTDRVAAALGQMDTPFDVVLNLQGDEPAVHPATLRGVVDLMARQADLPMGTASCALNHVDELFNPNIVKVVVNDLSRALYFSRSPIPYLRNSQDFSLDFRPWMEPRHLPLYRRHLGIYAYRVETLRRFTQMPVHPLEATEMLEQLRALAAGIPIGVAHSDHFSPGVDVPDDIPVVEALLRARV